MRFDKRSLADRVEIVFDDGGMNLLSSSALVGEEHVVGAGEDREADGVDVFLHCRGNDLLRSLPQSRVDHFHSGIAERPGDDLRAAIVAVEAGLRDENSETRVARHNQAGSR